MATPLPQSAFHHPAMFMHDVSRPGVQLILAQPWMAGLAPDQHQRIVESVFTIQGNKGEAILRAGDQVQGWYAVLTGLVKLQSQTSAGRRQGFLPPRSVRPA